MKIEVHEDHVGEFDSKCPSELEDALFKAVTKVVAHRAGSTPHPKDGTVHALTELADHMVNVYKSHFPEMEKAIVAAVRDAHGDQ